MNILISTLLTFKTELNEVVIDSLINDIEDEGVNSLEELKSLEQREPLEETVAFFLREIDGCIFEYDGRSYDEIQRLKQERKLIGNAQTHEERKHLILYCALSNRYIPFPFTAYQMILAGEL